MLATAESLKLQCLVRSARYIEAARLFEDRASRLELAQDPFSRDQWKAAAAT
jgi:hypothetical protein